jgi:xanthine dehydrogenase accessory factor
VVVTPRHIFDEEILAVVAKKPHAYLGMIGSSRKVETLKKRFLEEKILTPEELGKIDMPIGIKFKADTPQEIAISILAKLIDVRNSR